MVYFYRLEYDYNYHPVPIGPVYESTWYFDSDWLIYNGLAWYDQVWWCLQYIQKFSSMYFKEFVKMVIFPLFLKEQKNSVGIIVYAAGDCLIVFWRVTYYISGEWPFKFEFNLISTMTTENLEARNSSRTNSECKSTAANKQGVGFKLTR